VWRLGRRGLGEWIAHARDGPTRLRLPCGLSVHLSPRGWLRPTRCGATDTQSHLWLALALAQLTSLKTGYWLPNTSDELVRPREPIGQPYIEDCKQPIGCLQGICSVSVVIGIHDHVYCRPCAPRTGGATVVGAVAATRRRQPRAAHSAGRCREGGSGAGGVQLDVRQQRRARCRSCGRRRPPDDTARRSPLSLGGGTDQRLSCGAGGGGGGGSGSGYPLRASASAFFLVATRRGAAAASPPTRHLQWDAIRTIAERGGRDGPRADYTSTVWMCIDLGLHPEILAHGASPGCPPRSRLWAAADVGERGGEDETGASRR